MCLTRLNMSTHPRLRRSVPLSSIGSQDLSCSVSSDALVYLQAANYLEAESLWDLTAKALAKSMEGECLPLLPPHGVSPCDVLQSTCACLARGSYGLLASHCTPRGHRLSYLLL
jgi:hypothetical protein